MDAAWGVPSMGPSTWTTSSGHSTRSSGGCRPAEASSWRWVTCCGSESTARRPRSPPPCTAATRNVGCGPGPAPSGLSRPAVTSATTTARATAPARTRPRSAPRETAVAGRPGGRGQLGQAGAEEGGDADQGGAPPEAQHRSQRAGHLAEGDATDGQPAGGYVAAQPVGQDPGGREAGDQGPAAAGRHQRPGQGGEDHAVQHQGDVPDRLELGGPPQADGELPESDSGADRGPGPQGKAHAARAGQEPGEAGQPEPPERPPPKGRQ